MKKIGLGIGLLLFAILFQLCSSGLELVSLGIGVIGLGIAVWGLVQKC